MDLELRELSVLAPEDCLESGRPSQKYIVWKNPPETTNPCENEECEVELSQGVEDNTFDKDEEAISLDVREHPASETSEQSLLNFIIFITLNSHLFYS